MPAILILLGFIFGYAFKAFYPVNFYILSDAEFLNVSGTWIGAIGSLVAVFCAIYYSEKSYKLQTPNVHITSEYLSSNISVLHVRIKNKSFAPIKFKRLILGIDGSPLLILGPEHYAKGIKSDTLSDLKEYGEVLDFFFSPELLAKAELIESIVKIRSSRLQIILSSTTKEFHCKLPLDFYLALSKLVIKK